MSARWSQQQQQQQRIVITGFMGAGKTTVARVLAARLGCAMLDMDEQIVERAGRSIEAIIAVDGEARFREIETATLCDVLQLEAARVVALGGGAWTIERNRALIAAQHCLTVWLDAPFELCWRRITHEGDTRPLAPDYEQAQRLYSVRGEVYALASLRVEVEAGQSADDIAARLASLIEQDMRKQLVSEDEH